MPEVGAADSVIVFPVIEETVVKAGIPDPLTFIPTTIPIALAEVVDVRGILVLPEFTVPVAVTNKATVP